MGVRNDQGREIVMKLQGDRNENDRMFVSTLKFIYCRENMKWHINLLVIFVLKNSTDKLWCS